MKSAQGIGQDLRFTCQLCTKPFDMLKVTAQIAVLDLFHPGNNFQSPHIAEPQLFKGCILLLDQPAWEKKLIGPVLQQMLQSSQYSLGR
jgi:hypothetical protein